MKLISEIEDFEGKKVFVRVDWSVPTDESGKILDASRIEVSLPTIKYILDRSGLPVVASHFGREGKSIQPVLEYAKTNFPMLSHGVEFLENLRMDRRESLNNIDFAKELARKADFYVNEAFSVSHREHASVVGVPKLLPHFAGFRFLEEYRKLSEAFNPKHPFLLILGGAKFETKLPLIEKFLEIADRIFIGGALAKTAADMPVSKNPKVILPVGDIGALDANEGTLKVLEEEARKAEFILWNGPLGKYEDGYKEGTLALARVILESNAKAVIGGGDTESVIDEIDIKNSNIFISLSGGAMLAFLSAGTLPGIESLR